MSDESGMVSIRNKQNANLPNISVNDSIVAQNFLDDILIITKALGIKYFDEAINVVKQAKQNNNPTFYFKGKTYDAKMMMVGDSFILLKGSRIVKIIQASCKEFYIMKRQLLIETKMLKEEKEFLTVLQDIPFDSPSTVANIVCGRSANGRIEWKTEDGKLLKDFE